MCVVVQYKPVCTLWVQIDYEVAGRAVSMGELRKNMTSTGTITKKNPGYFGKSETVRTKFFLME